MVIKSREITTKSDARTIPTQKSASKKESAKKQLSKAFSKKPSSVASAGKAGQRKPEHPVGAQAGPAKNPPGKRSAGAPISPEERHHMIATAAYFRAEHRGFTEGCELEDWISGEAEIDMKLNPKRQFC